MDPSKHVELDLSFTETLPNLWDTYEIVLLVHGFNAAPNDFAEIMINAGFHDVELDRLYADYQWYLMSARPARRKN
jgi:hypothetical protein